MIFRAHALAARAGGLTVLASALLMALVGTMADASAAIVCKPRKPRPIITLKSMGACNFDSAKLSFVGEPVEQAQCLLRSMDHSRNLAPELPNLPAPLAERIGRSTDLPSREKLTTYLSRLDLERDFATYLWQPISRARDNDPEAPMARYFVIHDTSGPNFGSRAFPANIDHSPKINNLRLFFCPDGW